VLKTTDRINHPTQGCDTEPLLELRDLRTQFITPQSVVSAVDGVSLSIRPGQTMALVGESGSGKSVTALSILRLFNRGDKVKISGQALWRNRQGEVIDLLALQENELRTFRGREIGFVFQDPGASLNPVFTIGAQIRETLEIHQSNEDSSLLAIQLLRDVGIADPDRRINAFPHQLSGGMRQRVMLAMTLACQPRFLIADEPTTALDVTIQAQMMRLLSEIQEKHNMAMLFITHDLALVSQIADRVAVMYAGQVVETGSVHELTNRPKHPYTKALLDCRPIRLYKDDGPDERILIPIKGRPPRSGDVSMGCRFAPRCNAQKDICMQNPISLEIFSGAESVRCLRWRDL